MQNAANKQSLALANAVKEKLASREIIVQRQAILGLYNEIKNPNTPPSMANDIVQLLVSYVKSKKSNRAVATCSLDVLVQIFTELDVKSHHQIKDIPVQNVVEQLLKFAIQIHPALIPHLTRSVVAIYLGKFMSDHHNDSHHQPKGSKEVTRLCMNLTSGTAGSPLIMLIQNRNECLVEILNQLFSYLTNSEYQFAKLFRFFSPLFCHILTNRHLFHTVETNEIRYQQQEEDDGLLSDKPISSNINGSGTILRTDTMSSTHLKLKLLNELRAVILFKTQKALSLDAVTDEEQKLKASLLKQAYSMVLYIVHFLPSFGVDVNSDVVTACLSPLKTVLDLVLQFDSIFATLEEEDSDFCESYLSALGNEFEQISFVRSMVYRHFMSLYVEMNHHQVDIEMYFNYLFDICKDSLEHFVEFIPMICNSIVNSETEIEIDSWMRILKELVNLLTENLEDFEEFFNSLDSNHRNSSFGGCSFMVVVITNLLYPMVVLLHTATSGTEENRSVAFRSIQKIESFIKGKFTLDVTRDENQNAEDEQEAQADSILSKLCDILPVFQRYEASMLSCHYRLMAKMIHQSNEQVYVNENFISQWLDSVISLIPRDSEAIDNATYVCSTIGLLFLLSRHEFCNMERIRIQVVKTIESLTTEIITLKGGILLQPLIFYELPKETNVSSKIALMKALPKLGAKNDVNVTPIVKILSNMMYNKDLLPTVIRLFTELWKQNEKFFTKLKGFLFSFSKYIQSDSNNQIVQIENYDHLSNFDIETRLALACSTYEICTLKIDKGAELLPLITRMLCQENNATVLGYALKAITILCKSHVVDFYTVWYKVIQQNILANAEHSFEVRKEMCQFFQCSVEPISFDNMTENQKKAREDDEYNLFVDYDSPHKHEVKEVIDTLWNHTRDENEQVRLAAFTTLSMYPLHVMLYAMKTEESDDEDVPQQIGSEVLEQREENIFAKQEIRRGWLLNLCAVLIERLQVETSNDVLLAATPMIQHVLKAELRKPRNTSIVSKDKKASTQSIGLTSFEKFDALADFVLKQYESKKNMQVTAPAVLWQGNLAKAKPPIPETEAFKRLLNELAMDIVVGSSPEDFFSQLILTQGFFSMSRDYFFTAVESFKDKDSHTHFDDAFTAVFSNLKTSIDQSTVPSTTGNYILALAGLCLALPINAHHHVLKIIEIVRKKLSSSSETQEDIKYACNMVLASASFEIHIFSQLYDLTKILVSQLHGMVNENSSQDISSASPAIALGIIAKNLCLSKSDNYEKGLHLLHYIANNLYSLCFGDDRQLFELQSEDDKLKHINAFKNVKHFNFNWKQKSNLLFGIAQVTDTLIRVGQVDAANTILNELKKEQQVVENFIADPKSVDSNLLEICIPSCMVLSQIVLSLYHCNEINSGQVREYLDMYDSLLQKLEGKNLSSYLRLYMYASAGYGSLLFGALCESLRKGEEDQDSGKHFRRLYLEKFTNAIAQYEEVYSQGDSSHYQIGSLLFLACMLGVDLFSPISKSKTDDSDVFGLQSAEKRPLSISTYRSIFFSKILLPKNSIKKLAGRAIDIFRSSSTEPKLSIKVRKYSSLFSGIFSSIYKTEDNVLENADRIPVKYLSESGLVVYFVQKLTLLEKEESLLDKLQENAALHNLLLTEKLPKLTWSKVIMDVFRRSTSSNSDQISQNIQKNCIRFFCKDAQGTTSSSNSISAMSSLCEAQSFLSLSNSVQVEIAELFPQLIAMFPPSRTCSLIDDWIKLTFVTKQIDEIIIFTALKKLHQCEVKSNLSSVRKYVEDEVLAVIEEKIANLVSDRSLELLNVKNNPSNNLKNPFSISITIQIGDRAMKMIEEFALVLICNKLTNHTLLTHSNIYENCDQLLVNLLLRCQYAKLTDDISPLKLLRQTAVKGYPTESQQPVNNMLTAILTWLTSEVLASHISNANRRKFVQDTIDMLSFVFNDLESVYFSSYASSSQIPFALENLQRALLFLSSISLILGVGDVFAFQHAHDTLLRKNSRTCVETSNLDLRLLIHGLATSFKNKQLESSTEHSLMSRMYSLLANFSVASHATHMGADQKSNKQTVVSSKNQKYESTKEALERILFDFIIPLLAQIRMLRDDQHVSLNQIGGILENHALKMCSKLQK
ncbi:hypothetical protein C9374_000785 [Naegleria lovaniensis]|uniref:DUF3730 domain-containing protein n=1 Tax=Naegleria lovaniensis TaxID=51637 RepID=A0AA88GS87_NAELO|nr:uncharacterized protein C9374_000785 [Naegleria lovaniensis]KAG2387935.1 hypothetical protein C9374_000785 [Naegleria lovaniensis]